MIATWQQANIPVSTTLHTDVTKAHLLIWLCATHSGQEFLECLESHF